MDFYVLSYLCKDVPQKNIVGLESSLFHILLKWACAYEAYFLFLAEGSGPQYGHLLL